MAVAEIFIGALITVLFEKLASADFIKLAHSEGIYSQMTKWKQMLTQIQAVLSDAGNQQIGKQAVRLWLADLQHLAYDIDDILDDLATEALRRKLTEEFEGSTSSNKVRRLIPICCANFTPRKITYGRNMSSKLEEVTARLQNLLDWKNNLGLRETTQSSIERKDESLQTTSLVDESSIMGRETDKDALLKLVLSDETSNRNASTISIVGMGGIGKTTLAQLVYNSKEVNDKFELMAWVCVSDVFDVLAITKSIFRSVTRQERCDFEDLNNLQVALKQKLSEKRFLIVLDDLWNENFQKWELLQLPFQVGARGSKIVVTTWNMGVVITIGCDQEYHLKVLTDEESLSLFLVHATGTTNFDANPTMKLLGEGIARKCKGLPLALKMLGRVLHQNTRVEDWKQLLNSEIWDLQGEKNVILPALRLSYHHLPQHLHKLFAYCSLFPKDYLFDADELVLLWMAEGFLKNSDGNMTTEDLGRRCFEELLSRSLFQQSANKESRYLMHDLTNDLATFVAGDFFFRLDGKMNGVDNDEALKKLRHFSFVCQRYGVYRRYEALHRAKCLRTFLPVPITHSYSEFYLSNKVLIELLPQLQFLRVLSLQNYHIKEVPESIGGLKHLRYLNLSCTDITSLPEQVANLYNLQTLLLFGCQYLTKLPNSFAKLINLRHLDISDTPNLKNMPSGIGGLTSLQTLSKVIIGISDGFKMTELKGLSDIRGRLSMKGLHNVRNVMHAKEANMVGKKGVDDLEMEWSDMFNDSRKEETEFEVLDALRPQEKLEKLRIVYYGGTNFPCWVGDHLFVKLRQLTLRGCRRCTYLPSLGHLHSLQKLIVEGMEKVKTVGHELLGTGDAIAFPSLEILEFRDMNGWELWSTSGSNSREVFPRLCELRIHGCPNLVEVSIQSVSSIRVLDIDGCSEVVLGSMVQVASSLTTLRIQNIVGLIQLQGGVIEFLKGVEKLSIVGCKELRYLWESEAEACKILVNLRTLRIEVCKELVSLGEKEEEVNKGNSLTSLRELVLDGCPRLECFSIKRIEECEREGVIIFPNLERLSISWCSGMKWLPTGQKKLPSTLKALDVGCCENLLLEESGGNSSSPLLNSMSSLESISITKCPNLKWLLLDLRLFIHLTTFIIHDCEGIECFPEQGGSLPQSLIHLDIRNCKNLKWFAVADDELQSLTCLVTMNIFDCPSLDSGIPSKLWPPNLTYLGIGGLKKPMTEWGPQNFPTSLVSLWLSNESCLVSFAEAEEEEEEYVMGNHLVIDKWPELLPIKVEVRGSILTLAVSKKRIRHGE